MKKILEVKNINKSYQHNKAINNLSFNVYDGEILGLLGPNGIPCLVHKLIKKNLIIFIILINDMYFFNNTLPERLFIFACELFI